MLCRNGLHDRSAPSGLTPDGECRKCKQARQIRFNKTEKKKIAMQKADAKRNSRPERIYSQFKIRLRGLIRAKKARIAELEGSM